MSLEPFVNIYITDLSVSVVLACTAPIILAVATLTNVNVTGFNHLSTRDAFPTRRFYVLGFVKRSRYTLLFEEENYLHI
jgi:hypothetical protein